MPSPGDLFVPLEQVLTLIEKQHGWRDPHVAQGWTAIAVPWPAPPPTNDQLHDALEMATATLYAIGHRHSDMGIAAMQARKVLPKAHAALATPTTTSIHDIEQVTDGLGPTGELVCRCGWNGVTWEDAKQHLLTTVDIRTATPTTTSITIEALAELGIEFGVTYNPRRLTWETTRNDDDLGEDATLAAALARLDAALARQETTP